MTTVRGRNLPFVAQIQARARSIHTQFKHERVIGIRSIEPLPEPRMEMSGPVPMCLVQCDSVLEVRSALLESESYDGITVIVTNLDTADIGLDVVARLPKRRFFDIELWQVVKEYFQAFKIAPGLLSKRWIAELLLDKAPDEQYPAEPSGVLTEDRVWSVILKRFGFQSGRPDARELLLWTLDTEGVARYRSLLPDQQHDFKEWLYQTAGRGVEGIFHCINTGFALDATAIGLVLNAAQLQATDFKPVADLSQPALQTAIIRLERFTGNLPILPLQSTTWARAATEVMAKLSSVQKHSLQQQIQNRLDQILRELQIDSLAHLSQFSELGFEQSLGMYAEALKQVLRDRTSTQLESLMSAEAFLKRYQLPQSSTARFERVRMASRLARWLVDQPGGKPTTLAEAMAAYTETSCFVDWARTVVGAGDPHPELSRALTWLLEVVTEIREQENQAFARFLVDWTEAGSPECGVLLIEQVLSRVVAPLAQHVPVLLIVMDGMSFSVFRELSQDLDKTGWKRVVPSTHPYSGMALAGLPTVTQTSRASLFCGQLVEGDKDLETRGFRDHPDLKKNSRVQLPPKLLHKADLDLDFRETIINPKQKIIGVVVNVIDDLLSSGSQLFFPWALHRIPVLEQLLAAAQDGERVVILTSDHGHVLEAGTKLQPSDPGQRFRHPNLPVKPGEFLISGSRVIGPGAGKMIVAWSEKLRYTKKQPGYHGGISPQECIVPVEVLIRVTRSLKGFEPSAVLFPDWW